MGKHGVRVNLLVNNFRQLARSLILLAHYTSQFVEFSARSVSGFVVLARWTLLSAQYTVSVFESAYKHLSLWGRRSGGTALQSSRGRDTNSGQLIATYGLQPAISAKERGEVREGKGREGGRFGGAWYKSSSMCSLPPKVPVLCDCEERSFAVDQSGEKGRAFPSTQPQA
ncbi:hypothetical protein JZ751_016833 [Albula glossodonta]|uniref:Uncharacterized protein n=1 Tax=Albula glossodonta TaxID=121402 RepID=A0A8T2NTA6_9TELE|nr:hypothetical protein JZ751_016833 [Albula glossodonta]